MDQKSSVTELLARTVLISGLAKAILNLWRFKGAGCPRPNIEFITFEHCHIIRLGVSIRVLRGRGSAYLANPIRHDSDD